MPRCHGTIPSLWSAVDHRPGHSLTLLLLCVCGGACACACACCRGKNEHGAGDVPPGGENDYTFVVLPNDQYWLFVATGKNDTYSA
jgi:hypothetical protein